MTAGWLDSTRLGLVRFVARQTRVIHYKRNQTQRNVTQLQCNDYYTKKYVYIENILKETLNNSIGVTDIKLNNLKL